ncbi:MAG: tetratricopeptide repeat protein [Candidatus Thorarchaeota archaeon]|nr:tetratricopeptide repeat protein [Candidatus Thorarchaeota archaeon]
MIQREETSKTSLDISNDQPSAVRESDLRTRLRTFPRDAQSWYSLGAYLRLVGRFNEAEDVLRRAISLNPGPSHFWEELARTLMDLGRIDEAYQIYDSSTRGRSSITKEIQELKQMESSRTHDIDDTSPCISCKDYTYYGCSKGGTCDAIIRWRSRAQHLSIQNRT